MNFDSVYFTMKPSPRKHILCFSIKSLHLSDSGPFVSVHSSRSFLVSGQLQQIFLPLLPVFGCVLGAGVDSDAPILEWTKRGWMELENSWIDTWNFSNKMVDWFFTDPRCFIVPSIRIFALYLPLDTLYTPKKPSLLAFAFFWCYRFQKKQIFFLFFIFYFFFFVFYFLFVFFLYILIRNCSCCYNFDWMIMNMSVFNFLALYNCVVCFISLLLWCCSSLF